MLQPETLQFLRELKQNNNRDWFDKNKSRYQEARADFENFTGNVIRDLGAIDENILALDVKDCVFRIYRDVRFSKNKLPYKNHMAAGFNRGGRRVHFPGYYVHVEPDGLSYCGGGIWRPDASELRSVRQEIDYNLDEFKQIIGSKSFKSAFGSLETDDSLKRAPQGYQEDNPAISYLKLKSITAGTTLTDSALTSKQAVQRVVRHFAAIKPLVDFLARAIE